MIINRLHLINFGKFASFELPFTKDINIFYGLNEAGKTTIVDAIAGVLFGFAGRREDVKKLKARYIPGFNGNVYKAGLSVVIDKIGDLYIERDFLTNKVEVFTVEGEARKLTGFSVNDLVSEALGVGNIHLFRSTMLIRQEEMALMATNEVTDILTRKLMTGDDTASVKSIFRTLGQKYLELNRGLLRNGSKPGPIKQCQDEITRLELQLKSTETLDADYDAMLKQAKTLEEMLVHQQTRLQALTESNATYRKKLQLTQQYDSLLKRQQLILTRIEKVRQIQLELEEIEHYLETKEPYHNLVSEPVLLQISNLEMELQRLQEREKLTTQNLEYYRKLKEKQQEELRLERAAMEGLVSSQKFTLEHLLEAERLTGQISELNRQVYPDQAIKSAKANKSRRRLLPFVFGGALLSLLIAGGLFLKPEQMGMWPVTLLAVGLGLLFTGLILLKAGASHKDAFSRSNGINAEDSRTNGSITNGSITETVAQYQQRLSEITGGMDLEAYRIKVYSLEESKKRIFSLEEQIAAIDLQKFLEEAQHTGLELQQCSGRLKSLLEQAGTFTPDGFRVLYDNYWSARRKRDALHKDADRFFEGKNEAELNQELAEISGEIINLRTETASLSIHISEEQFAQQVEEESLILEQIKAGELELARIQTAITDFQRFALHNQDRWDLENTLLDKKAELDALTVKKDGIAEAVKVLRDSLREVQSGIAPGLGERASGIISVITDRKYVNIEPKIKETELNVAATAEGSSHQVFSGILSTGTRDQVYLALRLAIAEFLAGGRKFPLILDDPFTNFDEVRLTNTIDFLEQAAGYHQVILVTKDSAFLRSGSGDRVRFL